VNARKAISAKRLSVSVFTVSSNTRVKRAIKFLDSLELLRELELSELLLERLGCLGAGCKNEYKLDFLAASFFDGIVEK
jgi:hypothetical protein